MTEESQMKHLKAGASQQNITPQKSQFLYGYPHVERYSTGVHDPLYSSALYLKDEKSAKDIIFISNDIIYISKDMATNIRQSIYEQIGVSPDNILVSATHTHSGPIVVDSIVHKADPVIPAGDPEYIRFLEQQAVTAAITAYRNAQWAKTACLTADASGIGTNRRKPSGPSDPEVPVLLVKGTTEEYIACMLVCSMHPTVLHEDSTLVSADFPGITRAYLQKNVLGQNCPFIYHTGPAGNQSPRHVTKANTFKEAERLGNLLGQAVEEAITEQLQWNSQLDIQSDQSFLCDLPRQQFPSVDEAQKRLDRAVAKLHSLRKKGAPRPEVRTAECDWFGAERSLVLAQAARDGSLEESINASLPAEIQRIKIGNWNFIGWPGEVFVEYALEVKRQCPETYIIAYCNGLLNGYIVTREAYEEGGYEACTAQFHWTTGNLLVEKTLELINNG